MKNDFWVSNLLYLPSGVLFDDRFAEVEEEFKKAVIEGKDEVGGLN